MKSLSLIHAIVLLYERERLSKRRDATQLVSSIVNILRAEELACRVLGRNLPELPTESQILFLLLEHRRGRVCRTKKTVPSAYRFTVEEIAADIGWSKIKLKTHLNVLRDAGYLSVNENQYELHSA